MCHKSKKTKKTKRKNIKPSLNWKVPNRQVRLAKNIPYECNVRSDLVYKTNASVYNYSIICRESMSYFTGAHEHSAVDGLPTKKKSQADEGALHSSLKL